MVKAHPIIKYVVAALAGVFGLVAVVWAHDRLAPPPSPTETDSARAVKLRFAFADGHWAEVTEVDGGTIKIEKGGETLAIAPRIRDRSSGTVELRVSQVVRREGRETMEAVDSLLIDGRLTKLERGNWSLGVQVVGVEKTIPAHLLSATSACCARTCSGTLVCGTCVCTDCEACTTRGWCDCPPPQPPE